MFASQWPRRSYRGRGSFLVLVLMPRCSFPRPSVLVFSISRPGVVRRFLVGMHRAVGVVVLLGVLFPRIGAALPRAKLGLEKMPKGVGALGPIAPEKDAHRVAFCAAHRVAAAPVPLAA